MSCWYRWSAHSQFEPCKFRTAKFRVMQCAPVFSCSSTSQDVVCFVEAWVGQPVARGKISLARGIHCCPIFLNLFCPTAISVLCTTCVHTHTSDCVQTVYELPLLSNNTAVKHFYTNRSGAKCWLDIYRLEPAWRLLGEYRTLGRTFYNILSSRNW